MLAAVGCDLSKQRGDGIARRYLRYLDLDGVDYQVGPLKARASRYMRDGRLDRDMDLHAARLSSKARAQQARCRRRAGPALASRGSAPVPGKGGTASRAGRRRGCRSSPVAGWRPGTQ
ncbi:hypothetical protein BOSEA31B_20704 [Hyphomicrobiales bacterium]|nr:hypothetical protein BOSEA31B_20704 [Hyphomicrobiales bacterium]